MFELNLGTIIFLYIFATLGAFFGLWIYFERKKTSKNFSLREKNVWKCYICGYTYVDSKRDDLTECPQCQSINTREEQLSAKQRQRSKRWRLKHE